MKSKPLSMKKLYILLMEYMQSQMPDKSEESLPESLWKEELEAEKEILLSFLKYVWEHKNEV